MTDLLAVLIGLVTGATMSVAVSCVWIVLLIPARVQDRLQGASPCSLTWAIFLGLMLTTLNNALGLSLPLPQWAGAAGLLLGGKSMSFPVRLALWARSSRSRRS